MAHRAMIENMPRALALRHVAFEDLGSWEPVLTASGFTIDYADAGVTDFAALDPLAPDLVIVLGGPIGAYEEAVYPFLTPELRLVERRLAAGLPLLGVCLGAQIIARALGARVHPGPALELGWTPLELTEAGRASCIAPLAGEHTNMLHWHNDTFDLPGGATLLASTALTPHQVFSYGSSALAFQCHPEARLKGFERWLVGHTGELKAAGVDIPTLRGATARLAPALETQAHASLSRWLDELGL
jgi:GMP synthase (glutamine-hydrolysing)